MILSLLQGYDVEGAEEDWCSCTVLGILETILLEVLGSVGRDNLGRRQVLAAVDLFGLCSF
jgi:hypothetical protein